MDSVPNQQFMGAGHSMSDINQPNIDQFQFEIETLNSQFNLSQLQLKQLLDLFPYPAWIADLRGNIVDCNRHWHWLTLAADEEGDPADDSPGCSHALAEMSRVIHPTDRDRLWLHWQEAIASGAEFLLSCALIATNRREWQCVLRVTPVLENGTVRSWIGVCLPSNQDNFFPSEEKKADGVTPAADQVALAGIASPNRGASSIEERFLTIMSHELRTPLNAILGFSQLLLRQGTGSLTLTQVDMMHRILNNARQLLTLIDDILCLSMLEAGCLSLKLEEFDIVQVISAVIDEVQSQAHRKQLVLVSQLEVANPMVVNDLSRLRQVLLKLLYNAIKFTELGEVQVVLQEQEGDRLLLTICDTGIGIEQQDLQSIFDRFRQLDQSIARRYSGAGIGLAIVYWLVKLMRGNIKIKSQPQAGTTVTIELPRRVGLS